MITVTAFPYLENNERMIMEIIPDGCFPDGEKDHGGSLQMAVSLLNGFPPTGGTRENDHCDQYRWLFPVRTAFPLPGRKRENDHCDRYEWLSRLEQLIPYWGMIVNDVSPGLAT